MREQWRTDIGQLETPQLDTTCLTNSLVLHRRNLPFVREWGEQIAKVIPSSNGGVVNKKLRLPSLAPGDITEAWSRTRALGGKLLRG